MVFHELAHQVVYVADDTPFNESFATAVERLGGALWLAQQASPAARAEYAALDQRRQQFRALTRATRARLEQIYKGKEAATPDGQAWRAMKNIAMNDFRRDYASLRADWAQAGATVSGYDAWVAQANNAALGAQGAYDDLVPGFEALFVQHGRRWPAFYDAVRALAAMKVDERRQQLRRLASTGAAPFSN